MKKFKFFNLPSTDFSNTGFGVGDGVEKKRDGRFGVGPPHMLKRTSCDISDQKRGFKSFPREIKLRIICMDFKIPLSLKNSLPTYSNFFTFRSRHRLKENIFPHVCLSVHMW